MNQWAYMRGRMQTVFQTKKEWFLSFLLFDSFDVLRSMLCAARRRLISSLYTHFLLEDALRCA